MKRIRIITGLLLFCACSILAQESVDLSAYYFSVDQLDEKAFTDFANQKMEGSQFVMIGEQHGIQEVAVITDAFYQLGQSHGYRYLCVETDPLAAKYLMKMEGSVEKARQFYQDHPVSIPFYNNENDHFLFKNVLKNGGTVWGIDQTMMGQFRLNFGYLSQQTKSKSFQEKLETERSAAIAAYELGIEQKKFNEFYIFKYDEKKHQELLALAKTPEEKDIIEQLWKTRTIYNHYWQGEYYQNNNVRGNLMKDHFINYYKAAQKEEALPKVVFKLGANHAAKGLTRTSIYDISNLVHELANFNGTRSVHVFAMGITGQAGIGNPLAPEPVMDFDNTKMFPKEVQELINNNQKKYLIIDTEPMRESAVRKQLSKELREVIFDYDILVLVKDAQPVQSFE